MALAKLGGKVAHLVRDDWIITGVTAAITTLILGVAYDITHQPAAAQPPKAQPVLGYVSDQQNNFHDVGKKYAAAVGTFVNGWGSPDGKEGLTLLKVMDNAPGMNSDDVPRVGHRFVIAQFKDDNLGDVNIQSIDPELAGISQQAINLVGSDGHEYPAIVEKGRTTPGCPVFPTGDSAVLLPEKSVTGCVRFEIPIMF